MKIDLDTEDGKAKLKELIDAETEGLKTKNGELLSDLKKQKDTNKSFQEQLDSLKSAKEKAEEEAAEKSGDVEAVKKQLTDKFQKEIETRDAKLSAKDSQLNKILIDKGITEALVIAGVAPQHMSAVKALIKTENKPEISDTDGEPTALIDGKPLTEFITTWAQGDAGKHYVAAPLNQGGGSGGSNGGGGAPSGKQWGELKSTQDKITHLDNKISQE